MPPGRSVLAKLPQKGINSRPPCASQSSRAAVTWAGWSTSILWSYEFWRRNLYVKKLRAVELQPRSQQAFKGRPTVFYNARLFSDSADWSPSWVSPAAIRPKSYTTRRYSASTRSTNTSDLARLNKNVVGFTRFPYLLSIRIGNTDFLVEYP